MFTYDEPLYRPPSEAESLILQATIGCSHNRCRFCYMYKGKRFRARPWEDLCREIDEAAAVLPGVRRVFLADGDALALPVDCLVRILEHIGVSFPALQRVSAYATPQNLLRRTVGDLERLRELKLAILYYGIESGDPGVLARIDKGATPDEMADGCARASAAGLKLSATVILGLGGRKGSDRHARETASLVNRIRPRYLSALTLMLGPRADDFAREMGEGFAFNTPMDDLAELRTLVDCLDVDRCIFRSNHASNRLPLAGTLRKDRERLILAIDEAIADPGAHLRAEWMRGL
ncbi:MAG: radical SAM protein [Candidatus Krumholzibacteriota bacterium]|nr:radical SAM protein [Candidatus Krumholzibacteriota bacterium]